MTVYVPLKGGLVSAIDDQDADVVLRHKWRTVVAANQINPHMYAITSIWRSDKGRSCGLRMHRLILDAPKTLVVDHINGDTLDNRRCNLRLCTALDNARHRVSSQNRKRGMFTGVKWDRSSSKWRAAIGAGEFRADGSRKSLHLGLFRDPIEAARAYDAAARKYYGEFAALNFPDSINDSEKETG